MRDDRVIKLPVFRTMFRPIARKAWKCDICKSPVDIGSRYIHYIDRRPHEIINYRFHDECFDIVMAYCEKNGRTSFTPLAVRKWAKKTFCDNCPEECQLHNCKRIVCAVKVRGKKKFDAPT